MAAPIPTLRDIAKASGYHESTISRALGQRGRISAATRQQILKVAKQLGWKPNPLACAYMAHLRATRKAGYQATLAYLIPFRDDFMFSSYQQKNFEGARKKASAMGYFLEPIWLREIDFNFSRLSGILKNRGIPGLILTGRELPPDSFHDFDWNSFALATWGYSLKQPLHRAAYNATHGMRFTLQRLLELGYRRIALALSEDHDELTGHSMLSTFYYAEKHHAKDEWIKSIHFESWNPDPATRSRIKHWIETHRPQVIIGEPAIWDLLEKMGLKIPGDIAFASPFWSPEWPEVGGMDQRPEVIGAHAVDLVATQLMHNERGFPEIPKLLLSEGLWKDGASVPRLEPAPAPMPPEAAANG